MNAQDARARGLVRDAVVAELREVLDAADVDADVSVREAGAPVVMSRSDSYEEIMARLARSGDGAPIVVIELPFRDAEMLALAVRAWPRG